MRPVQVALVGVLVLSVAMAGCLGGQKVEQRAAPPPPKELSLEEQRRLEILAAPEIRNYTLPGSERLEPVVKWFNDTIGPEANTAYQDRNMRGGNDFNTVLKTYDVTDMVPDGQPTALRVKLVYFGQPLSSTKAHVYVCVPAHCSYFTDNNNDEFNWKATVEVVNVVTVGVSGEKHEVGIAAANGKMVSPVAFSLEVQASYFQDVLTPFHAYAFKVPEGATGVTLRSVKPGQEHLQAKFIVLDPQDELVSYTEYDDIAIVSESIFIPTRQPGEYVFYAQEMHNGFFTIVSDAPLGENNTLRTLPLTRTEVAFSGGAAPGVPERDPTGAGVGVPGVFPAYAEGSKVPFSVDQGFPVEMGAFIQDGVTGAAEIRILSSKGEVYRLQRVARVDSDQGSLGYTRDEANTMTNWANLAKGAYSVSLVSDAVTGQMGAWYLTFSR